MEKKALIKKTKLIFSKRYYREISDEEAEEIMQNLVNLMEILVPRRYNGEGG